MLPEPIVATQEVRPHPSGDGLEMRLFVERLPEYSMVTEQVVLHADSRFLELRGNPDDGLKIALHCANGEAVYDATYKPPYSDEHAGWGLYECRLLTWEPITKWERWF